ncbi:hypothetical protein S83_030995 [Arachis hypogaea]
MSLYCSSLGTIIPRILGQARKRYHDVFSAFTLTYVVGGVGSTSTSTLTSLHYKAQPHNYIGCVSKFDHTCSFPVMEEENQSNNLGLLYEQEEQLKEYSKELDVAVRAVQMACSLCQTVQDTLISRTNHQVHSKDDNSPVTVADWSVQAIVSWILSECLGSENISIVAEEDVQTLSKANASELLEAVVETVNECLSKASQFGVQKPKSALGTSEVLEIISRCNSRGGANGRFWVLDPVDGTLGFVRGDQYAVALALIEDGEVVLGVLGCPNYPMRKEWLSYQHRYHRIISKLTPPNSETWNKGCVLYAKKGSGKA